MDYWELVKKANIGVYNYLVSHGYTKERYNSLQNWERAAILTEMRGGLEDVSLLNEFGNELAKSATKAKNSVLEINKDVNKKMFIILGVVAIVGVIVYKPQIVKLLGGK